MPARTITTLSSYLASRQWLLHERGLDFVYEELKQFANGTVASTAATYGAEDLVTNVEPDATLMLNATQPGQAGTPPALYR